MSTGQTIEITTEQYQGFLSLQQEVERLTFENNELRRLIFGAKSERFVSDKTDGLQGSLFAESAVETSEETQDEKQEIKYKRNKAKKAKGHPLRAEIPAHLPRVEEVIEPEGIDQGAKRVGQEETEVLEYKPGKLYVTRYIRPKYICATGDQKTEFAIGEMPSLPIPKSNAGASLLAHVIVSKFVDHLPYYRQSKMLAREGLRIPDSTMGGWFSETCHLLSFLQEELKQQVLSGDYIQADETPIPVLSKDKPGSTHKGYYWVYYNPVKRLVLFDYRKSRGRDGPDEILSTFNGYLQTDGYAAYENLKNQQGITRLACMSHARRKFEHARGNDLARGTHALEFFQQLYEIEREARQGNLSIDETYQLRQQETVPVLQELERWLKEEVNKVLPKSAIGKAFAYTLKQWPRLKKYVERGDFQIDNNLIENSIRPVALGRKNYMFCGSHEAAQNAAMIYSFLGTCKINDVNPYNWLKETLEVLPECKTSELPGLLPVAK